MRIVATTALLQGILTTPWDASLNNGQDRQGRLPETTRLLVRKERKNNNKETHLLDTIQNYPAGNAF